MAEETRPRYFFVHLQKTGGTSVFVRLPRAFPPEAIYPNPSDGDPMVDAPQLDVEILRRRWAARRDEIGIVAGHFPLCTTEVLGGGFTTFTVLRDPVQRTLSFLRHQRLLTPTDADTPLEEIYEREPQFSWLVRDHMTKMLALRPAEMSAGALAVVDCGPEHLERACAALGSIDLVGVTERFERFWTELRSRFGLDLGPVAHGNRTDPVPVARSFERRIAADNALDVELHAQALELAP